MLDDIRGLIFDCDGTLVDSAPLYAKAWGAGFAVSGAVMADDWYHDRKGLSEHVLMESFEEASGLTLDRSATIATMREAFLAKLTVLREIRRYRRHRAGGKRDHAACRRFWRPSRDRGAVAQTHRSRRAVRGHRYARRCRSAQSRNPDLFLEAARRLGLEPAACLVLEDSLIGFKAAEAAGMRWLDVRDGDEVKALLLDLTQAQKTKQAAKRE